MSPAIDTTKVVQRRQLRFESLNDIAAEVERLASAQEVRALGNWSSGQVLQHLASTMNNSIDGFPEFAPPALRPIVPVFRLFMRLFLKRRFLTQTMPPGFKLPVSAAHLLPQPTDWPAGLAAFRAAVERQQQQAPGAAHPALGKLAPTEWVSLHCRHSELHLSFLVPGELTE
jgi:hypothetical protein